jgi:hypothetical protein
LDVLNSLVFNDMKIGVLVIKEGVMKWASRAQEL